MQEISQGVAIFTGTHYAIVVMQKERNLPSGDQYTPEEALDAISTCGTFAGTYTVSGNTVTAKRIANLRPTLVGVDAVWEGLGRGGHYEVSWYQRWPAYRRVDLAQG